MATRKLREAQLGKGGQPDGLTTVWVFVCVLGAGCWWVLRRPRVSGPLALAFLLVLVPGAIYGAGLLVVAGVASLPRWGSRTALKSRGRRSFYARDWQRSMTLCGLMKRDAAKAIVPRLVSVRCSPYFDHLTLHLRPGQTRQSVLDSADEIRHTYNSKACRVHDVEHKWHHGRGTRVRLDLQRQDALAAVVARLEAPEVVNLEAVAIGRTEYGEVWSINLLGTHYLVGGGTGSGKGSVLWSIINGVGPAIRDGYVELWGIDMKGGQELIHGREMFQADRYVGEGADLDEAEALISSLVDVMKERSSGFAETRERKPTISIEKPLILCVIDEAADLTGLKGPQGQRINGMLSMLCRRGRSVGITMVFILQDPRKEGLPFRDQIPNGIGLRLDEPFQIDAVLGPGSYKAGARCMDIPGTPEPNQPVDGRGIGYMTTLGVKAPLRVRASFVTDEDLREMCETYRAFDRATYEVHRPSSRVLTAIDSSPIVEGTVLRFQRDDDSEAVSK